MNVEARKRDLLWVEVTSWRWMGTLLRYCEPSTAAIFQSCCMEGSHWVFKWKNNQLRVEFRFRVMTDAHNDDSSLVCPPFTSSFPIWLRSLPSTSRTLLSSTSVINSFQTGWVRTRSRLTHNFLLPECAHTGSFISIAIISTSGFYPRHEWKSHDISSEVRGASPKRSDVAIPCPRLTPGFNLVSDYPHCVGVRTSITRHTWTLEVPF